MTALGPSTGLGASVSVGVPGASAAPSLGADADRGLEDVLSSQGTGAAYRYYEREYPQVDECVLVIVKSISETGAMVTLPEYGGIEGMILLSELSRRRIRSINNIIRVGKSEVAMVMRVDEQKGYIDLSKRRVSAEDVVQCEERFNKAKTVFSIMRHAAQVSGKSVLELNQAVAWPLARTGRYKSSYDALRLSLSDPEGVFGPLNLEPSVARVIRSDVEKRLKPQPVKVRADVEVQCFTYEGIEAVRSALLCGLKCGSEAHPISIKLIAPPLYVMFTSSNDKASGIAALEAAIAAIDEEIKRRQGKLTVKHAPRATSTQEENALATLLEQMEHENREVDGDQDEDEEGISGAAAASVAAASGAAGAGAAGAGAGAAGAADGDD